MADILLIETATQVCSVALARDGKVLQHTETREADRHAALLTVFIQQCLDDLGMEARQLHAVAVSAGPGSYTGLRVGVSAAKGLCYALGIPLLAVDTLQALAWACREQSGVREGFIAPMLDARRNEVWTAAFDAATLHEVKKAEPLVLENKMFYYFCESIRGVDEKSGILLCGNGAFKTTNGELPENVVLKEPYFCSAAHLAALAEAKFQQADFQDVLYYEPFYMKPPNITTAKKPL